MKKIPLTQNKFALVDDEDFERVIKYKWYFNKGGYAFSTNTPPLIMHRLIMNTPPNMDTDHINGNGLDNRRCNLRIATTAQNVQHQRIKSNNKTGYKGVMWYKAGQKWHAQITHNYKKHHLGYFLTKEEAIATYNQAAQKYFGEFAL